ncbi:type II/IV secretion system protein [Candidatus Dependentiae bacterium]|jgi:type II secretory ATPase GspE/PulE/Tfp pilus assembly ATPase PilB-like protein|nr:type II/IV secretion system protein [Candidatus Dependentiae bacterium]
MNHRGMAQAIYTLLGQEERIKRNLQQDPVVTLVDALLYQAIVVNASDIHLQPSDTHVRVRFRIDGVLYDQQPIPILYQEQVIARLKVLAAMDIAQHLLPQDGKCKIHVALTNQDQTSIERFIDIRVATFPSLYGEKMVLRLLDRDERLLTLSMLGFSDAMYGQLLSIIKHQHGLFLVTGPTGAGKTTTLYAVLSALNKPGKNIVTMEDPIEYELEGITQTQVNLKTGFSFENGLRSLVRQDPDIMMIGEVRDIPTVHIAVEAALTGHLVLSTLHTNDAVGALSRLLDMGVEPFLMSASVIGVMAQRLVRVLCSACKQKVDAPASIQEAAIRYLGRSLTDCYVPVGCRACFKLGYKGRTGVFELLVVDDRIKEMIIKKTSPAEIKTYAQTQGMICLFADGLRKVEQGIISLEELLALIQE